MSKDTLVTSSLPVPAARAVERLGRDIAIARTRRRIPQRLMAQRMMVSHATVQRLERGDSGVGIGIVATALWALGMIDRLALLAAPDRDSIGQAEELKRLPRRAHSPAPDPDLDF